MYRSYVRSRSLFGLELLLSIILHRMVEVGRDLWNSSGRSSGPTPLLKHGHLEPVAQDCVQVASEYLQG